MYSKTYIKGDGFIYSNNLNIIIFEKTNNSLKNIQKNNYAFANLNHTIYTKTKYFDFGFKKDKNLNIYVNNGFIQSWFKVKKTFQN